MNDFEKIDILELLPQRPPFVMVDRLLNTTDKLTETSLTVRGDNIFVSRGQMDEAGLVEVIAQTCAVRMGYINKFLRKDAVKLGFIGSIKNMEIKRRPLVGETLRTTIEVVSEVFAITLVEARVFASKEARSSEEEIASCQMKISITDIDKKE